MSLTATQEQYVKDCIRLREIDFKIKTQEQTMFKDIESLKHSSASNKWENVTARQEKFRKDSLELFNEKATLEVKTYEEPA